MISLVILATIIITIQVGIITKDIRRIARIYELRRYNKNYTGYTPNSKEGETEPLLIKKK